MARTLDEIFDANDLAILGVLERDGRAPISAIAREVGLPESTVRQRVRKILDSGLIAVVATGDPLRLGIPVDAISLVHVTPGAAEPVAAALTDMPEVRYVGVTLGGAIIVVESLHPTAEALHVFLAQRLPALPGVKEVQSHQVIDIRKSVWDWHSWLEASTGGHATPVAVPSSHRAEEEP
jgi:Lrp/AsnC family transcriptional regulator, regulator for asnA, asnC and gidA